MVSRGQLQSAETPIAAMPKKEARSTSLRKEQLLPRAAPPMMLSRGQLHPRADTPISVKFVQQIGLV